MREDKGKSLLRAVSDYTVIDLETTDRNANKAKIIELSALRVRNDEIVDTFSQLVNPQVKLPKEISELTGITDDMLRDQPTIDKVLGSYFDFIGEDIIIGHNIAAYDTTILCNYGKVFLNRTLKNDIIDTLRMAQGYCNLCLDNYKLGTVAAHYGIENKQAHRSLSDCYANFEVYKRLKNDLNVYKASKAERHELFENPWKEAFYEPEESQEETKKEFCFMSYVSTLPEDFDINGKNIIMTGDFDRGKRNVLESYLQTKGAIIKKSVNKKLDFLIVGNRTSLNYKYGNYGTKTENAIKLIDEGFNVKIVLENDFFEKLGD